VAGSFQKRKEERGGRLPLAHLQQSIGRWKRRKKKEGSVITKRGGGKDPTAFISLGILTRPLRKKREI